MPVTRSYFQRIPFLRITSLFLIGILLNHYLDIEMHGIGFALTVLISALILLWNSSTYQAVQIQNLLISVGIVCSGVFYPGQTPENKQSAFNRKAYYLAEVCQKPDEKAKTFQTILQVRNKNMEKSEKIIAYFSKAKFDSSLTTGDQLVILAKPQKIKNSGNPFEFDYQSMMSRKEVWYSVYLADGSYLKTGNQVNRLKYRAEQIRDKLLSYLSASQLKKEERSVVAALTLGYRAELEPETTDYFASTGAMHVLAVSGLHVGLIYFILVFFLSGIKRIKFGAFLFPALLIAFLWTYALVTGFSASVQRATVMFTFIIAGTILHRQVNIYNSLTAAALILILHHPAVLFEIGFQLSFLAVFGIVLIQPKLAGLLVLRNKLLKSLWGLFTVSIAAQLATFPLGLLYFNQFPNFFWLSNFVVIPGATVIIWLTFGFFLFSPLPFISGFISLLIQGTTRFMLWSLEEISKFPHAVSEGIIIQAHQVWIIYGILASLLIYGFSKRKQWLFYSLFLILLLQSSVLILNGQLLNQKAIFVYNSRATLIHLISGRTNFLITNTKSNISDQDYRIVQGVLNQLKLNQPVIIEKNFMHQYRSKELAFRNNQMNFLNCKLQFKAGLKDTNSDLFTLKVYDSLRTGKESVPTTISTGNTYLNWNQSSAIDFNTRMNGAFYRNLRE